MDIPWKNLMSNTEHLHRNSQSCIRTSSSALRRWCGESLPCLFENPASMIWPPHTYCVWPCRVRQKYPCTLWSIIGLRQEYIFAQKHLWRYAFMISKLIPVKPGLAAPLPCPYPASRSSWVPLYNVVNSTNPVLKKTSWSPLYWAGH